MLQDPNPIDPIELSMEDWEEIYFALEEKQFAFWSESVDELMNKIGGLGLKAYHAGTQGAL